MKQLDKLERRFPTKHAREAADKAIDTMDVKLPMFEYIDAWYTAYVASGGMVKGKVE